MSKKKRLPTDDWVELLIITVSPKRGIEIDIMQFLDGPELDSDIQDTIDEHEQQFNRVLVLKPLEVEQLKEFLNDNI